MITFLILFPSTVSIKKKNKTELIDRNNRTKHRTAEMKTYLKLSAVTIYLFSYPSTQAYDGQPYIL